MKSNIVTALLCCPDLLFLFWQIALWRWWRARPKSMFMRKGAS